MRKLLAVLALLAGSVVVTPAAAATTIMVDGAQGGRTYDGVGAVSGGGGNSKLLLDYPEPQRSRILDYLFKPGYGASIQLFKVEVGGDMNSTDGAEPSHMHSRDDENYQRGYEWWLMEQAKARNPSIKLAGLAWGAPGWIGGGEFWSDDMIDYLVKWLKGARDSHGLTIDYIGGWNENGWDRGWFVRLKRALRDNGLPTLVVGADSTGWGVADDMVSDASFHDAVDVLGTHYPCDGANGDDATAYSCHSTATARNIGKPLWASENGSLDFHRGADRMARQLTLGYVDARMTAYINWPLIAALPPGLPFQTTGLAVAAQPWSGAYEIGKQAWTMAHLTQFTQIGWKFIDSGSGLLSGNRVNGSYISLQAADHSAYSTVIETTRASSAQSVTLDVRGLPGGAARVYATNLRSNSPGDWFVRQADYRPGTALSLQPGYIYTISSVGGQGKGTAVSPGSRPFPLPHRDDFESYDVARPARYLADQHGSFEVVPCTGRTGKCVRQMAPIKVIPWQQNSATPYALIGDNSLSDYTISSDVLFEQAGSVSLLGRHGDRDYWEVGRINAYYFRVSDTGAWALLRGRTNGALDTLASGTRARLGVGTWHNLSVSFAGSTITARVDGAVVGSAVDGTYRSGPGGLQVGGWRNVQFDNLALSGGGSSSKVKIVNRGTGKVLATSGSQIVQWTDNGSADQQWVRSGAALLNVASGKALDVPGFSTTPGTQLIQWEPNGGANQQWTVSGTLTSVYSGLVADVVGSGDGAAVVQARANGGDSQQWELVAV
ncbi:galactosylceramidase [Lentzea sp. NBRC 105346]|uniref:RICIN domain-containing protein n=1 Tax=Lentzea sp. NBRC 105346 TaxID=3032205 RepID=UPI0024A350BC|nr:RICIN domain-containing protein [Lentzea sp. NBRC 105346]GLZ28633.1 galactosylceramidase [Lentzea sp. NBRC 105346]